MSPSSEPSPVITSRDFFYHLSKSLWHRFRLRKAALPLNPKSTTFHDLECQSCLQMVEQNIHGGCPICGSAHLAYIGRSQVLPNVEKPSIFYWGKNQLAKD